MGVALEHEGYEYILEEPYDTDIKRSSVLSKLDLVILRLHNRDDKQLEYKLINGIKDAIIVNDYSLNEDGIVFLNDIYREVK